MTSGSDPIFAVDAASTESEPTRSARSIVATLEIPPSPRRPPGPLFSFLFGFFSLGLLPALTWHDRFSGHVDRERQRLRQFADWLRRNSSRPETADLRVAGDDLGTRPLLSGLSMLCVVGVVVLFTTQLAGSGPLLPRLINSTYSFQTNRPWRPPLTDGQTLFAAWSVGLSVAYLFHWLQVRAHVSDVRRFVAQANRVFLAEGLPNVPAPRARLRMTPLWIGAAWLLASRGAWWGIAFALCGGAQQHYMATESTRVGRMLAARLRELANLPASVDPRAERSGVRCANARCLAVLSADARFCPRCGHNSAAPA